MVARIPLIVNPDAAQIQELPAGDTLDVEGLNSITLTADGTIPANAPVILTSAGKAKTISSVAANIGSPSTFASGAGLIDGITTNPTLIMKSVRYPEEVYQELIDLGIPDISMEVVGN